MIQFANSINKSIIAVVFKLLQNTMKKSVSLLLIIIFLFSAYSDACANPKHDYRARKTIRLLKSFSKQGTPMFGHQDDILYGHSFKSVKQAIDFNSSDVLDVCGDFPALLGLELGRTEVSDISLDDQYVNNIINAAIVHHSRGGIITISWHADNPVTKKDAWDMSEPNTLPLILEDDAIRLEYIKRLSKIADILDRIRDSKGRKIPIIFRPFHEENHGFWWNSTKNATPTDFKALWHMTYKYLVKERNLKNLIWAYSPYNIRTVEGYETDYPGDDYVDIVCYERYQGGNQTQLFIKEVSEGLNALSAFCKKHNKVAAMAECGVKSVSEEKWWTESLLPAIDGSKLAYVHVWRNAPNSIEYYAPFKGHKSETDFLKMYKSKRFLFLNDL